MNCDAFQDLLDEVLDRREQPQANAEIRDHVSACSACRATLHGHLQLLAVMREVERPGGPRVTSLAALELAAVAATIIIGWSVWFWRAAPEPRIAETQRPHSVVEVRPTESIAVEPARPADALAASPEIAPAFAMHPLVSLHVITRADWAQTLSSVPVPFVPPLEVPTLETHWLETIAKQMTPVQDSMSSTFKLLQRTLSSSAKPAAVNG